MVQQPGIPGPDQYVAEPGIGPPPAGRGGQTALIQLARDGGERTAGEYRGGRLADHQRLVLADSHPVGLETVRPWPASVLPLLSGLLLGRPDAVLGLLDLLLRHGPDDPGIHPPVAEERSRSPAVTVRTSTPRVSSRSMNASSSTMRRCTAGRGARR